MELYSSHVFSLQQICKTNPKSLEILISSSNYSINTILQIPMSRNCTQIINFGRISASSSSSSAASASSLEQPGGKMVVELVGAFNKLTERMNVLSTSSSRLLFKSLKLSIPILQSLPFTPDGRSPLTKALSVAIVLADLQMDAEVISASILREVLEAGVIPIHEVKNQIEIGTAHLLHESLRVREIPLKVEILDDDSAAPLRKFCLSYYDIRALILE